MTNQTQTGSINSTDEMLDEFNKSLRLYRTTAPVEDFNSVVNINIDKMRSFSKDDCFAFCNACIQYSVYLQRCENRERARLSVCQNMLNKIAGISWNDSKVYGSADLKMEVMAGSGEHPKLRQFLDEKMGLEARVQEITGLANIVRHQADIFREMARCK